MSNINENISFASSYINKSDPIITLGTLDIAIIKLSTVTI